MSTFLYFTKCQGQVFYYFIQSQMKNREKISFTELKQNIQKFQHEVDDFLPEKNEKLKKEFENIKDDIWLMLLESQERYEMRLERRYDLNKHIKEYNKEGPKRAIEEYIREHTKEFLEKLYKKWVHMDDKWNMILGKLKRGNQVTNIVPVQFTPKALIVSDKYQWVKQKLEEKWEETLASLLALLDDANAKSKNIFESYTVPSQLFEKLGISVQKVDYSFFVQENNKEKLPRKGGAHDNNKDKVPCEEQTFKKIWFLMKYLLDNRVPFRANNIIEDKNQWYQFYLYDNDITILISDVIMNNGFRDSTYVIKWLVAWLRNVNREELKHNQWKKIMFNDSRTRRIEWVFTDDPQNRPIIGEEKEESINVNKTLLTDRSTFIGIIKENFTPDTLTTLSYKKFSKIYNDLQGNDLLINDTIYGNASLLGLWGTRTLEDIKKAIFEFTKPKLEIPKDSCFSNAHTKQRLLDIQGCEWFDPEKILGSTSYGSWVMELLRKACNEEYVDAVKNKSRKEKKDKIEEYTGIKNIPLFALTITSMLWWRVRCVDTEYQKMLRKRFIMNTNNPSSSEEYKWLQKQILEYETKWEDEALHPNTNKSEKRGKKEEISIQSSLNEEKTEKISEVVKNIEENLSKDASKKTKEAGEKTGSELTDILKAPITMETFPLYKVKSAKIIGETQTYWIVKAYNCPIELRLWKSNTEDGNITIGDKIEIFGVKKIFKDDIININQEREKWYHKVVEFRRTHSDTIAEKFVHGEQCEAVVNNIQGKFTYLSLTRSYSWRILTSASASYKIGDVIKVTFDGMDIDPRNKTIVKIY